MAARQCPSGQGIFDELFATALSLIYAFYLIAVCPLPAHFFNVPFSAKEIPFKLDSLAIKKALLCQRIAVVTWFKVASETTGEI